MKSQQLRQRLEEAKAAAANFGSGVSILQLHEASYGLATEIKTLLTRLPFRGSGSRIPGLIQLDSRTGELVFTAKTGAKIQLGRTYGDSLNIAADTLPADVDDLFEFIAIAETIIRGPRLQRLSRPVF